MSVIVRAHDPNGAVSLIEEALGGAPGAVDQGRFVCIGDVIETDDQVGFVCVEAVALPCINHGCFFS